MSALSSKKNTRRWVIKIGSALLTNNGRGLDAEAIAAWVEQMAALAGEDIEFVLVSSGAVAAGMTRLGWTVRPSAIHELQAAAAVGQMGLVQTYEQAFQKYQRHTAQVLVDHDDLSDRQRYLNARSTLLTLLRLNVVPIVNENDTVVTDEIRFGDNDTLAALIANLVDADTLVILTDQDGMYDEDPRNNPNAKLLSQASVEDSRLTSMASEGGALGRGGMITKVRAAKLAARSGANTIIVGGKIPDVLKRLAKGDEIGTLLTAAQQPQAARKLWLAGQLQTRGSLVLDDGAVKFLTEKGKSLLPVGVKSLKGEFRRGDMVICETQQGVEVARGLVNYSSDEAEKILGQASDKIQSILGYLDDEELIHRDNLVLI
ncbi:MAG: glutamate 5-kinase [Cellvibrionaceae bacterium]